MRIRHRKSAEVIKKKSLEILMRNLFFSRIFFRLVRLCVGRASCQRPATGLLRRLRQLQQALRVRAQGSERCECGPAARERGDCCGPRPRDPIPGASAS